MDLHNNPNLGTDLLAVKVRQLEDKIKELTQTVGTVEGNIENLSNRVTTANLEAENAEIQNLSVTETLNTNAMVLGESLEVGSATIGEVSATSVSSEEIDSAVSHIGEADGESLDLTGDIHSASIKLDNLVNDVPIATTQYVGYNNNGKLIPVDPTKGVAKWENTARSNTIKPVDNANVDIPSELYLGDASENPEVQDDDYVLGIDSSGRVCERNTSNYFQKKLVPGYNISIDEQTNTISCDIQTMTFKGSVDNFEDLPQTGNVTGDVWNVTSTSQNFCWDGTSWIAIGTSVDLSDYYTKTETDGKYAPKSETVISEDDGNILKRTSTGLYVDGALIGVPIGAVVPYTSNDVPSGFLLCDGSTYNKADYPLLYAKTPAALRIDENTFKVPDLREKFVEGASGNIGTSKEAGLPNITGIVSGIGGAQVPEGAFYSDSNGSVPDGAWSSRRIVKFDASKGETKTDGTLKTSDEHHVFGASDTVQPASMCLNYIIKATNYKDVPQSALDDSVTTTGNVWSASKTKAEIESVDNKNNYSTEETVIGTWIDGKPIYRKVYVEPTKNNWTNSTILDTLPIQQVVRADMIYKSDTNNVWVNYQASADARAALIVNITTTSTTVKPRLDGVSGSPIPLVAILEYTKTTD